MFGSQWGSSEPLLVHLYYFGSATILIYPTRIASSALWVDQVQL